ncbi:hypothetical protein E4K10_01645 [Streptomyces sp. T1317-0309]|nr:hypothetical protein E4K10_01645 [Streptomyces sp. T1317-0309]
MQVPGGVPAAHRAGVPKQAYRRDDLSAGYRLNRARLAEAAATAAQRETTAPGTSPSASSPTHGANLVVEDCDIRTWYRLWGKALQATTPGRLTAAVGPNARRPAVDCCGASTFTTKLSQTCLCGAEVKKTLADRVHRCTSCGLVADRDMVSAALAAHVRFSNPDDPSTAGLDTVQARMTQTLFAEGLQEALSSQPQRGARPRRAAPTRQPNAPSRDRGPLLGKTPPTGTGPPRMRPDPRASGTRATSEQPP